MFLKESDKVKKLIEENKKYSLIKANINSTKVPTVLKSVGYFRNCMRFYPHFLLLSLLIFC